MTRTRSEAQAGARAATPGGSAGLNYARDAAQIYRESFAIIRSEADLTAIPADLEAAVVRRRGPLPTPRAA